MQKESIHRRLGQIDILQAQLSQQWQQLENEKQQLEKQYEELNKPAKKDDKKSTPKK